MSNSLKTGPQPEIIVFGLPHGKPRAGTFMGSDVPAARKAAAKLGLAIIDIVDQAGLALAAKVSRGRVGNSGDNIIPTVTKDMHARITAYEGQRKGQATTNVEAAPSLEAKTPRLPRNWDEIKVGDLVLAQDDDPADGWWQVTVIEANSKILKLRWPSGRGRSFQKHRAMVGLICPTDIKDHTKLDHKQTPSASEAVYPRDWSAIGLNQIVLAREDGPCQQWWEAKAIKVERDLFTLQWRDHPQLPAILRPRSVLGLLHPAPKTR